ncbi:PP2C family protein-serine/threonine phosphatase [Amycolatopsis sp. Hca4]|uniref:PP2C family protein-serine/threonine phosphatase n=1 Tax=Amycolatopsis sp. Hca4 TaxID=2742131 RepID=UPI0020CACEDE|nr:SpoIIE family protein phosphatase [Amycolatopsis sp. Hca4]
MSSTPEDSWTARLHALWRAAFEAVNTKGLSDELYSGLLTLPSACAVLGARLAADGTAPVVRWADHAGLRTQPPGLAAEALTWVAGHPAGDKAAIAQVPLAEVAAIAPALATRLAAAGATGFLVVEFAVAAGERGLLGLGTSAALPADPAVLTAMDQVLDVIVATDHHASQLRELDDRQAQDAILAEASLQMSASLDIDDTLRAVVRMVVPGLADGAVLHVHRDGRMVPIAVAHVDAHREQALADAVRAGCWAGQEVVRGTDPASWDERPRASELPAEIRLPLLTISALRAHGRDVGLLSFFHGAGSRRRPDRSFLSNLAGRAALAIDNATLYDRRRRDVLSLQQHLLPAVLPAVPGLELAAKYNVADHSLEVGGDFYGVVPRPDGTVTALIGDVCGRGAPAAALTGLARHTLETALEEGGSAEHALVGLNTKLLRHGVSRFLTLATATFEPVKPDGVELTLLAAGHPPPMVLRRDGTVDEPDCAGRLVGVLPELRLRPAAARLTPGDTLVLYTDGLTEARDDDGKFFETDLAPTLAGLSGLALPDLLEALVAGGGRYRVGDDAAVLAIRHTGAVA